MKRRRMKVVMAVVAAVLAGSIGFSVVSAQTGKDPNRIIVDGSTTVGPIAKAFAEYYMEQHPDIDIAVSESGSGNGAKSLINGACDVADMSRFMKDTEFKAAIENGIMPVATVVAMDGLPVLVHPSNPVDELSIQQVRDIYTGKITNWREVGGPNVRIVKITRDTNSGTYETFETKVMSGEKIGPGAEYVGSNGAIRQRVQTTPAAIGYAGLGFVDESVKALSIKPDAASPAIYPDRATVSSGRYPIARPLFMFTNGYPALGTPLHAFVTLYLSEQGEEIVEGIGFVPVTNYAAIREGAQ